MIVLDVLGTPAPKGSNRAILRGGRPIVVPGSSDTGKRKMQAWDSAVREAAADVSASSSGPTFVGKPLRVGIVFRLQRPGSHWSKKPGGGLLSSAPIAPAVKPDVDKLARTTLDALTGILFDDDSRIVELGVVKIYATPGREGARITVDEWKAAQHES